MEGLGLVGLLAFGMVVNGCDYESNHLSSENPVKEKVVEQVNELQVLPLSVKILGDSRSEYGSISIVGRTREGKPLICHQKSNSNIKLTDAAAFVQSEIDDRDGEQITLYGKFEKGGKAFYFDKLCVDNYCISF